MMTFPGGRLARRRVAVFGILFGISLLLMVISSAGPVTDLQKAVSFAFRPLQSSLDSIARGVTGMVGTITEIDTLHRTNEELARANAQLEADNARAQEIERQNGILTDLLKVKSSIKFTTVAASVIGREPSTYRGVVTLDVGTDNGVKDGDVVIGAGGALVGRITDVTGDSASVLLVSDPGSTVIGQLGAGQVDGELIGQLGDVLRMENIDSTQRIDIGDQVMTAGIDLGGGVRSPFPKGLLVGSVVDVERDANSVTQTAFVQPAIDLDHLEYVLVITNYEGGLPPVDQQPVPCPTSGTLPAGEQPCYTPTPPPQP